eukprot:3743260-Amphidinium_carterae.1
MFFETDSMGCLMVWFVPTAGTPCSLTVGTSWLQILVRESSSLCCKFRPAALTLHVQSPLQQKSNQYNLLSDCRQRRNRICAKTTLIGAARRTKRSSSKQVAEYEFHVVLQFLALQGGLKAEFFYLTKSVSTLAEV